MSSKKRKSSCPFASAKKAPKQEKSGDFIFLNILHLIISAE